MRIIYLLLIIGLPMLSSAQIWTEDFDGANMTNTPVWTYQEYCTSRDYLDVVCDDGSGCPNEMNSDYVYNGSSGQYLGVRDVDHNGCTGDLNGETITFNGIDISSCGFPNITYLCFRVAESRNMNGPFGAEWGTSAGVEDTWDGNSSVKMKANIDGGGFQTVTAIEAMVGGDTRPGIDVNCDNDAGDAGEPELTDTFIEYCFELPGTGALLDLQIEIIGLNTAGEDIAIDDLNVYCEANSSTLTGIVLPSCTAFTATNPCAIFTENFEGGTIPAMSIPCGQTDSRDYLAVVCLDGQCSNDINSDYEYFGATGMFLGARDMNGNPCGSDAPQTATTTGIDISSCTGANSLYLCFDIAESNTQPREGSDTWDGNQGNANNNTFVTFSANIDGTDSDLIGFAAVGGNNSGPALDTDCDGVGEGVGLSPTFTTFCVRLPNLGNTLDLNITIGGMNTDGDDVAIDNITVLCSDVTTCLPAPVTATTCAPNPCELFTEDFEGGTSPAMSIPCGQTDSRDYLAVVCLDGQCPNDINSDYEYFGATGMFLGARDMNGNPCGSDTPQTATTTGIDISSCTGANSLYLCFDIAESNTQPREGSDTWDGNQGNANNNTFVTFSADIDGTLLDLIGFAAVGGNNSGPALDADCDGVGEGVALSSTFTTYCVEIPTLGNALDLNINIGGMNTDGDDVAIDNVTILCSDVTTCLPAPVTATSCAVLPFVCPTVGAVSTSVADVCANDPFDITATGLIGMDVATNTEQDFGIEFVSFAAPPADPYAGGTSLGTVPFAGLTGANSTASLTGVTQATPGTYQIYAILSPAPMDAMCRPSAVTTITVNDLGAAPTVMDIEVCDGESTEIFPTSAGGGGGIMTVYQEGFDEEFAGIAGNCPDMDPANCATFNPPSNGQWSVAGDPTGLTATSDFFNVFGGVLNAQDTDTEVCFLSSPINIAGLSMVELSVDLVERGTHEAADFVDVTYIVDGLATTVPNWMGLGDPNHTLIDDFMMTTVTASGITGTSLQIQICVMNNAGSEDIDIDNVVVTGVGSSAPMFKFYDADPSLAGTMLLAGPAISYDPQTTTADSPETIWVTECGATCDSDPVSLTVTVNALPELTLTGTDIDCLEGSDGAIDLTVVGNGGFTYLWMTSDGSGLVPTDQNQTGLSAGTYDVMVTDINGCMSMGSIMIMDGVNDMPPTITCPAAVTVECGASIDPADTGMPVVVEDCDPDPLVLFSDDFVEDCSPNAGTITRTFTVTDAAGNSASCTQLITIEDNVGPTFTVPGPVTITCLDDPTDLMLTGDVTDASDACDVATTTEVWINEIHYDNAGTDSGEFVEIAGTAGTNLAGYELYLYNGSNNLVYFNFTLSGIIPNESNGIGAISFTINGLQNGSPDGIALTMGGVVVQFISYEGTILAADGPAIGTTSMDVGVQETGTTPVGQSIQLMGTGNVYADFTWSGPATDSPGLLNTNQIITALPPVAVPTVIYTDVEDLTGCGGSGMITRTWTATDACGNGTDQVQIITVVDDIAPTAVCMDITVELDENGMATILADELDNGSSDACGTLTFTASQTIFTCADLAAPGSGPGCSNVIPVTLTVADDCGNVSTCVANVTVEDNLAPVLTCPADMTLTLDAGECGKFLSYQVPFAVDNCEMMMTTTFLGTTFNDNNGFAGNMFDIENVGSDPIAINSFDVHLATAAGTNHTVGAWYVTGGGSYVGNEMLPAAWTLMGDVPVISAGPGNPSSMLAGGLVIQPGETYGIYIFQTDGGSDIDYTNGTNTYTDGNMQLTAGLGRGTPVWTGGVFTPRTWNGNVHYSISTGVAPMVTQTSGPALTSGDYFPIGTYTYEFEAEDGCGNVSTCTYTFVLEEFPNPTASLSCNQNGLQISLDENCEAIIGADDILEGGPYGCYENYEVELFFDANMFMPVPGSPVVNGSHIGMTLYVKVNDAFSNNSCWGTIIIEDKQIPNLECADVDVSCTLDLTPTAGSLVDFPVSAPAVVFQTGQQFGTDIYTISNWDGCGLATLSYSDLIQDIDCLADPGNPYTKVITRTWTATDESGNTTTCSEAISLIRATIADIVLPADYDDLDAASLSCEEKETANNGFCGAVVGWNAIDAGEYAGDLYVGHPSPSDVLYPCGTVKWFGTGIPGGIACGNINYSFADIRINSCASGSSEGCFKILRDWSILDWCTGDLTTHRQIIKVSDDEGPSITDLADVTISTDVWQCAASYYVPEPWIMDNCSDIAGDYTVSSTGGTVTYVASQGRWLISGLTPYSTYQVTVRAEDCCGNATNFTYDVTVLDLVPPTAVCEVFYQTSLSIDGTAKIFASTFDDGSHDVCNPVFFKTIRMDDLLGTDHGSTSANQNSTTCDPLNGDDNAFRFGNQIYFDDYNMYCCEDIANGTVMTVFRVFDVNPGAGPVAPSRMSAGGDLAGRFNDCMVEVTVQDKLPPTITAPDDVTVTCDFWFDMETLDDADDTTFGKVDVVTTANAGTHVRGKILVTDRYCDANGPNGLGANEYDANNPTQTYVKDFGLNGIAVDNCLVGLAINVNDNLECGQGQVTRVFTATDPDGRTASAVQRITIVDCDPFFINDTNCFNFDRNDGVDWPCDVDVSTCGAATAPTAANSPRIFNDDNCALISVTHVDENFPVVPNSCFKIKRIWTVTDWCNFDEFDTDNNDVFDTSDDGFIAGQWEYVQYLVVLNSMVPVVDNATAPACSYNTDCTADPTFTVDVSDDCTPGDLLIVDFKLDANNDGVYDAVGANVTPYPYINPNNMPVVPVTYTDVDGDGTYTASVSFTDIPLEAEHRILWSAEDACSNVGTETLEFTINDCKLPTPKLVNGLVIETMPSSCMIDVPAMMFDAGSFDNCGVAQILIVSPSLGTGQTNPPASASAIHTFNSDDIGTNTVDIWVQDVNGNWAYATTFLNLQDNTLQCGTPGTTATISGGLTNEAGQGAEGVDVSVDGGSAAVQYTSTTDVDGDYAVNAATGQNYVVSPEKLDEVREGISTLDLVLISRHLIGLQPLDSPYKMIAADVNNDNGIDGFDLIDLQKVILFIYDEFPNNTSFRFVDSAYDFAGNSPFANAFPEQVDINNLTVNEAASFMAIKTGDVNGSAQMNSSAPASNRSYRGEFFFNVADRAIVAGETYTVDFTANDYTDLLGYQFAMDFNQSAVDFVDVVAGNTTTEFGTSLLNAGVLTASYGSTKAQTLENGTVLFTMTLTAKVDGMLSEVLNINRTRYTRAEAYQADLDHMNVNIQFTEGDATTIASSNFELLQNQPNPFKDVTEIGFVLPEAASATITIYDVSGRLLSVIEGDYAKGYNKETVITGELGVTGVLYYQLDTDEFSATKKMIIID